MMDLSECLTEDSEIFLIGNSKRRTRRKREQQPTKLFYKDFNHAEFIGEELCAAQNIRCTHYFLIGLGEFDLQKFSYYGDISPLEFDFKIASYDFKRPNREYRYLREYRMNKHTDKFSAMLEKAKDSENEEKLCREMLQLIALDIFMGQIDRYNENIVFETKHDGELHLAPLFDFERSLKQNYLSEEVIYDSELYLFSSIDECKKFIKKYPLFRDILGSYLDIDLKKVIERAYHRRGLVIPEDKWTYYQDFETKRKQMIKQIIN